MIYGKSIKGEQWFAVAPETGDLKGNVHLVGEIDGLGELKPVGFTPQEARDLAKSLEWAAEVAESVSRRGY